MPLFDCVIKGNAKAETRGFGESGTKVLKEVWHDTPLRDKWGCRFLFHAVSADIHFPEIYDGNCVHKRRNAVDKAAVMVVKSPKHIAFMTGKPNSSELVLPRTRSNLRWQLFCPVDRVLGDQSA